MLGIRFKTKKELKAMKGKDISEFIIETSMFGREYDGNNQGSPVCVSLDPHTVRNVFAQIWVTDNILTKVT
jgi:hypothetical protein